ncbi:MAG: hypothetical protein P0Y62_05525 [Candidatus Chryseobacterium colombiense]|nr:hypothetical protein [Chryseobacterium sp.]WEK71016.1 MAG: hypothetical protein P0Y62_05525 [Chryseobacterium sp.]
MNNINILLELLQLYNKDIATHTPKAITTAVEPSTELDELDTSEFEEELNPALFLDL